MALADRVGRFLRAHDLARPDTRVVAAVSGGPDSTALVHLLRELETAGLLRLIGLAHFNHQLRPAADDDERFVAELARVVGLPLTVERENVRERAEADKRSIEAVAHTARYQFFERVRTSAAADVVALGHTRDDQAETFLLRLLRGAGARGLAAMHPRTGSVIRPLLECRRSDLLAYLQARGLPFRIDESNADTAISRNRVRHELLPLLEQRFNPSVIDALADAADIAREEARWLDDQAARLRLEVCRREGDTLCLAGERLRAAPLALARLAVREALLDGSSRVSFEHVQQVLRLVRGEIEGPIEAPGLVVERRGLDVVLVIRGPAARGRPERDAGRATQRPANFFEYSLSIPGEALVAEAGWIVAAQPAESVEAARAVLETGQPAASAVVPLVACELPLRVRNRRAGDRLRPLGLGGTKKLQDFFVDRKIDRRERDTVPLVVDRLDRIIWVGGHAVDEAFRVTDPAQAVLVLKLTRVAGGSA